MNLAGFLAFLGAISLSSFLSGAELSIHSFQDEYQIGIATRGNQSEPDLVYHLRKPSGSPLSVESGGFFHPLRTPGGEIITDLAPSDHLHHRGIFLAFVEVQGRKKADFWGWGQPAPTQERNITNEGLTALNSSVSHLPGGKNIKKFSFIATNAWKAEGTILLREVLRAELTMEERANILRLDYTLHPETELHLAQWSFSGFCVRLRKDGQITMINAEGEVNLPNPSHLDPKTDWPDQPWYGCRIRLPNGKEIGAAVLNHPQNPPTLWHNNRDVRMLNPSIVAPAGLQIKTPLRLRYLVVAWDGDTPGELLNFLYSQLK